MKCLFCQGETSNPKFCSRSCSVSFNNTKYPKNPMKGICKHCGIIISSSRSYCGACFIKKPWLINKIYANKYLYVKAARTKIKERAVEYLGGKCYLCGYNRCNRSLVFHHRNPNEKDFSISTNCNKAWDKVKVELDKCTLLCANCHGEVHEGLVLL